MMTIPGGIERKRITHAPDRLRNAAATVSSERKPRYRRKPSSKPEGSRHGQRSHSRQTPARNGRAVPRRVDRLGAVVSDEAGDDHRAVASGRTVRHGSAADGERAAG